MGRFPHPFALGALLILTEITLAVAGAPPVAGKPGNPPAGPQLSIRWENNMLTITGPGLPGNEMEVWYLEAYCRPGSTDREWEETVIGHKTTLIEATPDGRTVKLQCKLTDGVTVDHVITAGHGEVDFQIVARNPTAKASQAHWAQPCVRVGAFTGTANHPDKDAYLGNCFVYLDDEHSSLPTKDWATKARYVPGQVWSAPGVDRDDVNPRPLNPHVPSNGLIGCASADRSWTMAIAFEPYQELFQGVIRCIHSDFRIGGLQPGESRKIRGKIYLQPGGPDSVLSRYEADFPDQVRRNHQ
jgi:hypothetical protein